MWGRDESCRLSPWPVREHMEPVWGEGCLPVRRFCPGRRRLDRRPAADATLSAAAEVRRQLGQLLQNEERSGVTPCSCRATRGELLADGLDAYVVVRQFRIIDVSLGGEHDFRRAVRVGSQAGVGHGIVKCTQKWVRSLQRPPSVRRRRPARRRTSDPHRSRQSRRFDLGSAVENRPRRASGVRRSPRWRTAVRPSGGEPARRPHSKISRA
jgi:hypothetical protein